MTKDKVDTYCYDILDKVISRYGYSKYHPTVPYLVLDGNKKEVIHGEYCSVLNEIVIYYLNIESIEQLKRTIIHEYQHYLQSPVWMDRYYKMGHTYQTHPYEIQAYKEEDNWIQI